MDHLYFIHRQREEFAGIAGGHQIVNPGGGEARDQCGKLAEVDAAIRLVGGHRHPGDTR
jgi:hypothetical protein